MAVKIQPEKRVKVKENLVGRVFGELTVLEQADDYVSPKGARSARWRCRCSCGNEVFVVQGSLKSGTTTNCGIKKDLVGKQFGDLTVLARAENYVCPKGSEIIRWRCKCACGNEVLIYNSALKSGRTNCGKCNRVKPGNVYGKLTVLEPCSDYVSPQGTHHPKWKCFCSCGKETTVREDSLKSGNTKSCGMCKK